MITSNSNCGENSADAVGLPVPPGRELQKTSETDLIDIVRHIGDTIIGPNAQTSDQSTGPNHENMQALAEAGLFGLGIPREYGGLDASGATQREVTELLASYCGVTTFTQAQHHGPCRMIFNSSNIELKCVLLPELASGRMLCAVSFAHLRRPGPPVLRAEPIPGGYRLNGTTPWVTGWGLMNQVVFGATLPDERFVYLWVPEKKEDFPALFTKYNDPVEDWGTLTASKPLQLCAMNASSTVELTCTNLFVPEAHRLFESNRETMRQNDRNGVLGATAMPMGCSKGSIRLLHQTAEARPGLSGIRRTALAFSNEWEALKAEVRDWSSRSAEPGFFEYAVSLRARVIQLAVRAAHAAVTANSGAANNLSHPAQRLYREAMFYTIQAQTPEVMNATLSLLEINK